MYEKEFLICFLTPDPPFAIDPPAYLAEAPASQLFERRPFPEVGDKPRPITKSKSTGIRRKPSCP